MNDAISDAVKGYIKKTEQKEATDKLHKEFADFDCSNLSKMKNKDLAAWQAKYPMDSPQYIIALQEWNRRAIVKQIKATKFAAYIGVAGALLGVVLGFLLTLIFASQSLLPRKTPTAPTTITSPDKSHNKSHNKSDTTTKHSEQGTKEMKTQPGIPINNIVDPAPKTMKDKHVEILHIP